MLDLTPDIKHGCKHANVHLTVDEACSQSLCHLSRQTVGYSTAIKQINYFYLLWILILYQMSDSCGDVASEHIYLPSAGLQKDSQ